MKFTKNWKRFWTLNRHHAEGFTLVELIVVIAILAILAGVAVPAYSGYVTKANKQADISLASEIEYALTLKYYSDPGSLKGSSIVVLTTEEAYPEGDTEFADAAMNATFGSTWMSLTLKYDNYSAYYQDASYAGKETELLGQVNNLSNALASSIASNPNIIGTGFGDYLKLNGLDNEDSSMKANAAVLYIAQNTTNSEKKDDYLNSLASASDLESVMQATSNFDGGVTGLATLYAVGEGFLQYVKEKDPTHTGVDTLHSAFEGKTFKDEDDAQAALLNAISSSMNNLDPAIVDGYFAGGNNSQAVKDAQAFLDIMETVNSAENQVLNELKNGSNFSNSSTISSMMDSYAVGGIFVVAEETPDGTLKTQIIGLE